jgi:colicin import membrane protein
MEIPFFATPLGQDGPGAPKPWRGSGFQTKNATAARARIVPIGACFQRSRKGSNPLAELRESSLLFSLDSLLNHEKNRVEEARVAAERRREEEEARRTAEERAQAEAKAREQREAEARAAREAERSRDEEARLEGIRQAEVERTLAEARLRGEIELALRRSEHELRIATVKASNQARVVKGALVVASALAVVASVGALVLEFGVRRPGLARLQAKLDTDLASERTRSERTRDLLDQSERRARRLEEALKEVQPVEAPRTPAASEPPKRPRPAPSPARPGSTGRRPCTGNPDDPLNPCL